MKYLLDTNLISEPQHPQPDARVLQWLFAQEQANLFVSSLVLAEIWQGVLALPQSARRLRLEAFARELPSQYRILNFDLRAARVWGELVSSHGRGMPILDSLLAAVALSRGLVVVTRDEADFRCSGTKVFNPWTMARRAPDG